MVGLAVCAALLAALDVELLFLVGPAIAVGAAAYAAYRTAIADAPRSRGRRPS